MKELRRQDGERALLPGGPEGRALKGETDSDRFSVCAGLVEWTSDLLAVGCLGAGLQEGDRVSMAVEKKEGSGGPRAARSPSTQLCSVLPLLLSPTPTSSRTHLSLVFFKLLP